MSNKDDELKYYAKRTKELNDLLKEAKSQTLIDIITKAISKSDQAVEKLISIQNLTIAYLKEYQIKHEAWFREFKIQEDFQSQKLQELKQSQLEQVQKDELLTFYKNLKNKMSEAKAQREDIKKLQVQVYRFCVDKFSSVLLQNIFKPNLNQFHAETIMEALNYIAGKIIPLLDEAKIVYMIPPS